MKRAWVVVIVIGALGAGAVWAGETAQPAGNEPPAAKTARPAWPPPGKERALPPKSVGEATVERVRNEIARTERDLQDLEKVLPNYTEEIPKRIAGELRESYQKKLAALKAQLEALNAGDMKEAERRGRQVMSIPPYTLLEKRWVLRLFDENNLWRERAKKHADDPEYAAAVEQVIAMNNQIAEITLRRIELEHKKHELLAQLWRMARPQSAKEPPNKSAKTAATGDDAKSPGAPATGSDAAK